jgi:hypothetical protein
MSLEYLKTLGRARQSLKTIASTPIGEVLSDFANHQINELKRNQKRYSTGSLNQSFSFQFGKDEDGVSVEFLANDYWDFINSGVNGLVNNYGSPYSFAQYAKTTTTQGWNFKESIGLWIQSKGIKADDEDYDGLAYVIMRSVKEKGIKPNHFLDETFNEDALDKLEEDIFKAFQKMI